ncbi:MAG TPA: hypothetical protein VFV64_10295 [Permianibacter sp.]|nr:hypothetical protein [Permianibacter sp.]
MFTPIKSVMRDFIQRMHPEAEPVLTTGNPMLEEGLSGGLYPGETLLIAVPAPLRQIAMADLMLKTTEPCAAIWLGDTDWRDAISLTLQQECSSNADTMSQKSFARATTSELPSLLQTHGCSYRLIFIDGLKDTPETALAVVALRQWLPTAAFVLGFQPAIKARYMGMASEQFDCAVADKTLSISMMSDFDRPYAEACSWRTGRQSGAFIQVQPNLAW